MRADMTWETGGTAELLSFKNDWLTVLSSTPQAPGKPWRGALAAGGFVGLKVKTCKKQPSGLFVIEGPSFDLTRESRQALVELAAAPATTAQGPAQQQRK